MALERRFSQLDVFTDRPLRGNPLAVVHDAGGLADASYVASQGTVLGRAGRVHVRREAGETWIGGAVCPVVAGTVRL
jgi:predicted PhzF superfamily epimerase YddE/YHI9